MNYDDSKLLLEYARLQLAITQAKAPGAKLDVTPETIRQSTGYKKLIAWFRHLSPRAKVKGRKFLTDQIVGVRDVLSTARKTGEDLTLADIEFEHVDAKTGEPIAAAPVLDAAQQCTGSGQAVQFMRTDDKGKDWAGCSGCDAQWPAKEIDEAGGFLPVHAESIHPE